MNYWLYFTLFCLYCLRTGQADTCSSEEHEKLTPIYDQCVENVIPNGSKQVTEQEICSALEDMIQKCSPIFAKCYNDQEMRAFNDRAILGSKTGFFKLFFFPKNYFFWFMLCKGHFTRVSSDIGGGTLSDLKCVSFKHFKSLFR